jgi:hypothetical protein
VSARAIVVACALLVAACGPLGPPSAPDILGRPGQADLRDAHVTVSGSPGVGAADVDLQAAGDVVFRPQLAFHFTATTTIGQAAATTEVLAVAGATYQRSGQGRWSASGTTPVPPGVLSPWTVARDPRYLGEEDVNGARSWHVAATAGDGALDLWVRESDGFPVRARVGQLVVDYGRFNRGVSIAAPPASAIQQEPKSLSVKVGEVAHLRSVDVSVTGVELTYRPANRTLRPRTGYRFVVARVAYVLTAADRVSYGPLQWRLTDTRNATYAPAFLDREPRLAMGDISVPGATVGGFVGYEAPVAARGLLLRGAIGDDSVTVSLG